MKRGRPKGKSTDKRSFGPLGDLIRKRRLERGLGLRDVAKAVRCSVQFISNIEHGRAPLPWDKAERLSACLEIPMDELQSANLRIRADFKSFMASSRGKRVSKANTALGALQEATGMAGGGAQDPQLNEIIRKYQSLSLSERVRLYSKIMENL